MKNVLQSGWLLGEEYLKDQANILAFTVGKGYVVTYGSQIDFRAQPRTTFKLIFNGMFHGPATPVPAAQMGKAAAAATNDQRRQHPFGHGRLATSRFPPGRERVGRVLQGHLRLAVRGGSAAHLSFTMRPATSSARS